MKNEWRTPFIAVVSAAVGASAVYFYNKYVHKSELSYVPNQINSINAAPLSKEDHFQSILKDQEKLFKNFEGMFNDDFFHQADPFEEMKKMRKRFRENFGNQKSDIFSSPFDSWYEAKFGGGSVEDIKKREDKDFIYYDIKINGIDSTTVNTSVKDGNLTITGETKQSINNSNEGEARAFLQSSFRRSFPLPNNVKPEKMEILHEKNTIILKFPKL